VTFKECCAAALVVAVLGAFLLCSAEGESQGQNWQLVDGHCQIKVSDQAGEVVWNNRFTECVEAAQNK